MDTTSNAPPAPPFTVPPDPGALLAALAARLDDADLRTIAGADDGEDAEHHLAALHAIARGGVVPSPLPWCPREVLELVRWEEPKPEPGGERPLWRHAFACCALLRAYGDPDSSDAMFDQDPTLAGLMGSLHDLASLPLAEADRGALAAMDRQAAGLLAWLTPRVLGLGEAAFFGVALLWFALAAPVPDGALSALVYWILRTEEAADGCARQLHRHRDAPRIWLIGPEGSQRAQRWRGLGASLPGRLRPQHGPAVAEGVQRIGTLLARPDPGEGVTA